MYKKIQTIFLNGTVHIYFDLLIVEMLIVTIFFAPKFRRKHKRRLIKEILQMVHFGLDRFGASLAVGGSHALFFCNLKANKYFLKNFAQ